MDVKHIEVIFLKDHHESDKLHFKQGQKVKVEKKGALDLIDREIARAVVKNPRKLMDEQKIKEAKYRLKQEKQLEKEAKRTQEKHTGQEKTESISLDWIKYNIPKWIWAYHNIGFNLIPISYKTKVPPLDKIEKGEIKKWQYKRQPKELIQKWLDGGFFEGVAILGGHVSQDIVCFDIDDPQVFKDLELSVDLLIKDGAWITETPKERGRYHIVIRDKNEVTVTRKQRSIDYRANEHYWLVYPSVHPNGKQYNFLNTHNPDDLQLPAQRNTLAMFDTWNDKISELRGTKEKLLKTGKTKGDFDKSPDCIRNAWKMGAPVGQRYYIAIALGSWLQQQGFPEEMAEGVVVSWFKSKCDTKGRDVEDIKNAVATAYTEVEDEDGEIGLYKTGCNFWKEKTEFCPYPDKKDCPFKPAEIKGKKDLLEEYGVFYEDGKGKQKIITAKLGDLIYSEHGHFFTIVDNKEIYTYNGHGCYENSGDAKIRNLVEYYLEDFVVEKYKNEVVGWIRDHNYVRREDINVPLHLINVQNGILNIETMKLIEHTPDLFFLSQMPVKFNPKAKCDNFRKFLQHISMKEGEPREKIINTIQEYLGYCFLRAYPYKNYIVFDGGGDNGKTTLLNVVVAMIGMNNNTSVSLQDLNHRPFAKSQLFGKHVNVSDDLPKKALKYTGEIKQITGNSPLWADIKNHKKGICFVNYAKPWYACNELPLTYDYSDAFFSRMIQITLLNKYLPEGNEKINDKDIFARDTNLITKLTTDDELSGVLNFALEGLKRLKEKNNFSDDMTTEERRTLYLRKTNPIHAFIEDEIEITGEDWCITVEDFFSELTSYCERNEFDKPTSRKQITSRILDENIGVQKRQKTVNNIPRVWCWVGIKSITESTINHFLGDFGEQKNKMII